MPSVFTPSRRGGSGSPLVCLHGFTDTWRTWELVLPELERHHDVLAPTLPGHAGGPPLDGEVTGALIPDAIERAMDEAGFTTAQAQARAAAPHAAAITATPEGRRQATRSIVANPGHMPAELIAHQMLGVALCAVAPMVDCALREGYRLDAEAITCPVRIVWGTEDALLPCPGGRRSPRPPGRRPTA